MITSKKLKKEYKTVNTNIVSICKHGVFFKYLLLMFFVNRLCIY